MSGFSSRSEALLRALSRVGDVAFDAQYINLRHRTDRRDAMRERLKAARLHECTSRFEAQTGLEADDGSVYKTWDSTTNARFDRSTIADRALRMSSGERGCAASHVKLWKACAARSADGPPLLILEDDAVLCPEFKLHVAACIAAIHARFPVAADRRIVLFLGARVAAWQADGEQIDIELSSLALRELEYSWWAGCYLLWPAAAQHLISQLPVWAPVDVALSELLLRRELRGFAAVPLLAWAASVHADMDGILRHDPDSDILHTNRFAAEINVDPSYQTALDACQQPLPPEAEATSASMPSSLPIPLPTPPALAPSPSGRAAAMMELLARRERNARRHVLLRGDVLHESCHSACSSTASTSSTPPSSLALQAADRMWLHLSFQNSSFHGFGFVLRGCSAEVEGALREALDRCLAGPYAFLAGHVGDNASAIVPPDPGTGSSSAPAASTDHTPGVPFAVAASGCPLPAACHDDEDLLYSLSDFENQVHVADAEAPLLSARLTRFYGGGGGEAPHPAQSSEGCGAATDSGPATYPAFLCVSVAHVAMDGGALSHFVHAWARVSAGEDVSTVVSPPRASRCALAACAPAAEEPTPAELASSAEIDEESAHVSSQVLRDVADGCGPRRACLHLPSALVARLKAAAAAGDGTVGGGWVTTQEALAAQLLRALWRLAGDRSKPRGRVLFWLDGRKYLHDEEADTFGNFTIVHAVVVPRVDASLQVVAQQIHEQLARVSTSAVKAQLQGYEQLGLPIVSSRLLAPGSPFLSLTADSDEFGYTLKFNNLSKVALPTFGPPGAGCMVESMLATAGPSLLLPTANGCGGVRLFLKPDHATIGDASVEQVRGALLEIS